MVKSTRIVVVGKVQGVGFRQNMKSAAEDRNLSGYAQNNKDGSVEIVLQGGERQINEMVDMLRMSPAYEDVQVETVERVEKDVFIGGFRIRVDQDNTMTSRYEARSDLPA